MIFSGSTGSLGITRVTSEYRMRMKILVLALLLPLGALAGPWPAGKLCAVSLTYDDGLDSQILNAVVDLYNTGLKATFFPTGTSPWIQRNSAPWKLLVGRGHELGSHTMLHPCAASMSFVKKGNALEDYDDARMSKELDDSMDFLEGLGAKNLVSFAYPCGATYIGAADKQHSYIPLVKQRFRFARGVGNILANPATVNLYDTPGWSGEKMTAKDWEAVVEQAKSQGAWLIIMFHGVGGDYLTEPEDAHKAFLQYLQKNSDTVWTAPFGQVANAVAVYQKSRTGGN